jgi:Mrp family chromosome partitioning ATPase
MIDEMDAHSNPPLIASEELQPVYRLAWRTVRRWRVAAKTSAVVLALTLVGYLAWPKVYRSEAVVHYQEGMQWTTSEGGGGRRVGQRLKDVLLARGQLTKVIVELGLYPGLVKAGRVAEAVEEMRLATGFRVAEGDAFVISFNGESAEEAQRVTARLTELLAAENQRLRSEQAETARAFLDAARKRTEVQVNEQEAAQLRFLAAHPEFAHDEAARSGAARSPPWRPLETEVRPPEPDNPGLAALGREEERLRRQLASPRPLPRAPQDPALVAARNDAETNLRTAQRELAEKRAAFTELHPDVLVAEAKVQTAREAYQRSAAAVDATEPAVMRERLAEVQREIAAFRRTQVRGRGYVAATATSETAQRVVAQEAEWARLSREVAESRERYRELQARQFMATMTANMAAAGQAAQIVVVDDAYLPAAPVGPTRSRLLVLALLMASVAGAAAALLAAVSDDRILERADVERLGLGPLLAEVPGTGALLLDAPDQLAGRLPEATGKVPAPAAGLLVKRIVASDPLDPRLFMVAAPDSAPAAAFRILRHRLKERGDVRTILVSSPEAGEGKSLCAANLALALGESGSSRVLLLEVNLRRPSLARLLGFQPPACVSQQLERRVQAAPRPWLVVENLTPWVHTAAVAPGVAPRPILDGPALAQCLVELRGAGYDYVVIDSPAILESADVNVIAGEAEGFLVTLRAGRSRARAVRRGVEQIGGKGLLGFVLLET